MHEFTHVYIAIAFLSAVIVGTMILSILNRLDLPTKIPKPAAGQPGNIVHVDGNKNYSLRDAPVEPPKPTSAQNGKILSVSSGVYQFIDSVPDFTTNTYTTLKALPAASRTDKMVIYVACRAIEEDGAHGNWVFRGSSSATTDEGTVIRPDDIAPVDMGRWHRLYMDGVLPEWWGASVTSSDNSGALTSALMLGETVHLNQMFPVTGAVTSSSVEVTMVGNNPAGGILLNHADAYIMLAVNAQSTDTPPQKVDLRNFQINVGTGVSLTNPAISIVWSAYQPTAEQSLYMEGVKIIRADNGTGVAPTYLRIEKCAIGVINGCLCLGDDAHASARGVELIDCIGIRMSSCDINRFSLGMDVSILAAFQTEGIMITDCQIYDCDQGISVDKANHFNVHGTHVNINGGATSCCINLQKVEQYDIRANILYCGGHISDPVSQDAIRTTSETRQGCISGNTLIGLNTNARDGIRGESGFVFNIIDGNTIIGFNGFGVNMLNGANSHFIYGNHMINCTISDLGSNRLFANDQGGELLHVKPSWRPGDGTFLGGEISCTADWGAYIKGRAGGAADVVLASSGGANVVKVFSSGYGTILLPTSTTGLASGEIWNNAGTVAVVP